VAQVALPSHHSGFCPDCFRVFFARQVERAIHSTGCSPRRSGARGPVRRQGFPGLFRELVLQGYNVTGLHIDLGIPESSPAARAKVEAFCAAMGARLTVLDMAREGLPIPRVKACVTRPICAVCGKIKRYYFNKFAMDNGFSAICTGHNLDDEVGRLLANTCAGTWPTLRPGAEPAGRAGFVAKCRPLYRLSEYETAAYAFLSGIDIHVAPCPYSKGASFTRRKELMNRLEGESPGPNSSSTSRSSRTRGAFRGRRGARWRGAGSV
jgi:tRNA(Ile)-lysidine synthase TilS/MesJ